MAEEIQDVGTNMYEMNKTLLQQNGKSMSSFKIRQAIEDIAVRTTSWAWDTYCRYVMLLCNERKDYTIFHINDLDLDSGRPEYKEALIDCLHNRGEIYDIHVTEDKMAYEIWLKTNDDKEFHVYYLFPYDNGVIEIGE